VKARKTPRSQLPTQNLRATISVVAEAVDEPFNYLCAKASGSIQESTMLELLDGVRKEVNAHPTRRLLVDLREGEVHLSISDMNSLAKLVLTNFAGVVDKIAIVMRREFILPEKFFEPLLRSRGLPVFVTEDWDEAVYWLGARFSQYR
jgi:hypothetical protein